MNLSIQLTVILLLIALNLSAVTSDLRLPRSASVKESWRCKFEMSMVSKSAMPIVHADAGTLTLLSQVHLHR